MPQEFLRYNLSVEVAPVVGEFVDVSDATLVANALIRDARKASSTDDACPTEASRDATVDLSILFRNTSS